MPELLINKQSTITGIQKQFNNFFPFLKIEFFHQAPIPGIGNAKNKMITIDMKIGDLIGRYESGFINFSDQTKVKELENKFEKDFGLYIQVFRKSGKVWLETTATDNWTLEQQNEEGKSLDDYLSR